MNSKQKTVILINTAFYLFFTAVIYIVIKYFAVYILPFIISFVLVYVLQRPAIAISNKINIRKNVVTLICLIIIVGALFTIIYFSITNLFGFFKDLSESNWFNKAMDSIKNAEKYIPMDIIKLFGGGSTIFSETVKSASGYIMGVVAETIKRLPGIIFSVVTSLVSACFLAFEYDNFILFVKRQLSKNTTSKIIRVKRTVNESLLGFFKGYLIIMLFTLLFMVVGLKILSITNAFAIAIIIALIDVFPVFGTGIIMLPWAVYQILNNSLYIGIGLIVLYVVYSVLRYFLEPRIIGKKVGVNPLISLLAMFLGLKIFGVIGLILAPITVSVLMVLHKNKVIKLWN